MKIVIEYNSLVDAASNCKCYDDFTYEGWNWLEQWHDGFMGENETLEPFDLKHEYYEQPLSDIVDFDDLGDDVYESELIDWLRNDDYILDSYEVEKWDDETGKRYSETYVISYRDASEPCLSDMPEEFFKKLIPVEEYLGFSVGDMDKEELARILYEDDCDGIVIDYEGENVIVDKRENYEEKPFKSFEELKNVYELN